MLAPKIAICHASDLLLLILDSVFESKWDNNYERYWWKMITLLKMVLRKCEMVIYWKKSCMRGNTIRKSWVMYSKHSIDACMESKFSELSGKKYQLFYYINKFHWYNKKIVHFPRKHNFWKISHRTIYMVWSFFIN